MRYLVTGGAGFIGSNLVRTLVPANEVVILDDMSRGKKARLRGVSGVEWIVGDVRDEALVHKAVQGCDMVIHLAYLQGTQTFYSEPRKVLDVAMRGMLNVLSGCERWGVTDLMLVSSSEAYQVAEPVPTPETVKCVIDNPLNPRYSYGGGKLACEMMVDAWARTGILDRAIIARPHNIFGPDMGREHVIPEFCLRMNDALPTEANPIPFPIQGSGQETRSFCYIGDCVDQLRALDLLAPEGTEIYHIGQEDERTIGQLAHDVAGCYGREVKVVPGKLPKGSPVRRLPDTTKIRNLIQSAGMTWKQTPFLDGLDETVTWYKHYG